MGRSPRFAGSEETPDGRIAQLVEQLTLNQRVLGSSPSASTKTRPVGGIIAALGHRAAYAATAVESFGCEFPQELKYS